MNLKSFALLLFILATNPCFATDLLSYYVSPEGSDSNSGAIDQPLKTIEMAQTKVRANAARSEKPLSVYLRGGTYYLDKPIVFTTKDSGNAGAEVSYSAYQGEKVVLSGGSKLSLNWKNHKEGILKAKTPAGIGFDQLFINGKRQSMARYPNYDPKIKPYNGYSEDAFSPKRAANWLNPKGGFIHAMHRARWGGYHYLITGKQPDNNVTYEGGWQNNRQMGMHKSHRFVENIFEELDAPGEWFHDFASQTLYYYPPTELDIETATVEVTLLKSLIELRATQEEPITHFNLDGLIFRHAVRTFMETKEPLLRSDWAIYRGGALFVEGAEDCHFKNCEFDQVGGNAVFLNEYNRRVTLDSSHMHGIGASAVCFVGDPASVRDPLFEYRQTNKYSEIDRTPGPKSDNYPADCTVDNCLIHDIGVVEKQAAGVQISMSQGITVRNCSIYDVGRAGINISEGTFGGHLIEYCDVFDTVRETGDHGSFNSWGRDRFWHLKGAPEEELPELALLDTERTVIRNSRWRCDHGWDIDLDDGSSNYEIYNNLMLHGGLKLREGFHRHVHNNICINNGLHPHVWYKYDNDVITNNLFLYVHRPVRLDGWGKQIDHNIFVSEADLTAFQNDGWDKNSIVCDPLFVDPSSGDYSLRSESPALKAGFKNFPMDQFGVKKPELKAIARVPDFPVPEIKNVPPPKNRNRGTWLGAKVKELEGQEFSAYGVSEEERGILLLEVPTDSKAYKAGFKKDDVVQRFHKMSVRKLSDLSRLTKQYRGQKNQVDYVRGQISERLEVAP